MAGRLGSASQADIASGTSLKTLVQIVAPTNQGVFVNRIAISMDGVTNTNKPPRFQLSRQTTAGTMSTLTPVKRDGGVSSTLQTTARHTATVEPTTTDLLDVFRVHPQTGIEKFYAGTERPYIAPGERVGITVLADVTVNCSVSIGFEE